MAIIDMIPSNETQRDLMWGKVRVLREMKSVSALFTHLSGNESLLQDRPLAACAEASLLPVARQVIKIEQSGHPR